MGGKVSNDSVVLDSLEVKIDFVVKQMVPFDLGIGRPALKRLDGVLDFRTKEVCLDYRGQRATISMISEYSCAKDASGSIDRENFSSDSDKPCDFELIDEGPNGGELVLCLRYDAQDAWSDKASSSGKDRLRLVRSGLGQMLRHLLQQMAAEISDVMDRLDVVACSLRDIRSATVPLQPLFDLNSDGPIYRRCRRMTLKHNDIAKKKLGLC